MLFYIHFKHTHIHTISISLLSLFALLSALFHHCLWLHFIGGLAHRREWEGSVSVQWRCHGVQIWQYNWCIRFSGVDGLHRWWVPVRTHVIGEEQETVCDGGHGFLRWVQQGFLFSDESANRENWLVLQKACKLNFKVLLYFIAFWAFMYFIAFVYLWSQWSSAPLPPGGVGSSNMEAAIFFSFFSIFVWVSEREFTASNIPFLV